jgi:hypothetical protein
MVNKKLQTTWNIIISDEISLLDNGEEKQQHYLIWRTKTDVVKILSPLFIISRDKLERLTTEH